MADRSAKAPISWPTLRASALASSWPAAGELLQHVAPALVADELHLAAVELEVRVEVLEQGVAAADLVLLGVGQTLVPRLLLELVVLGAAAHVGLPPGDGDRVLRHALGRRSAVVGAVPVETGRRVRRVAVLGRSARAVPPEGDGAGAGHLARCGAGRRRAGRPGGAGALPGCGGRRCRAPGRVGAAGPDAAVVAASVVPVTASSVPAGVGPASAAWSAPSAHRHRRVGAGARQGDGRRRPARHQQRQEQQDDDEAGQRPVAAQDQAIGLASRIHGSLSLRRRWNGAAGTCRPGRGRRRRGARRRGRRVRRRRPARTCRRDGRPECSRPALHEPGECGQRRAGRSVRPPATPPHCRSRGRDPRREREAAPARPVAGAGGAVTAAAGAATAGGTSTDDTAAAPAPAGRPPRRCRCGPRRRPAPAARRPGSCPPPAGR